MDEATTRAAVTAHWQAWLAAGGDETDAESVARLLRATFPALPWTAECGVVYSAPYVWSVDTSGPALGDQREAERAEYPSILPLLVSLADSIAAAGVPVRPAESGPAPYSVPSRALRDAWYRAGARPICVRCGRVVSIAGDCDHATGDPLTAEYVAATVARLGHPVPAEADPLASHGLCDPARVPSQDARITLADVPGAREWVAGLEAAGVRPGTVRVRPADGEPLIASLDKLADLLDEDFSGRTVDEILGRDAPEDCPGCVALRARCERLAAVVRAHQECIATAIGGTAFGAALERQRAAHRALKPGDLPARAAESEGTNG